jgi:hypothetical protein
MSGENTSQGAQGKHHRQPSYQRLEQRLFTEFVGCISQDHIAGWFSKLLDDPVVLTRTHLGHFVHRQGAIRDLFSVQLHHGRAQLLGTLEGEIAKILVGFRMNFCKTAIHFQLTQERCHLLVSFFCLEPREEELAAVTARHIPAHVPLSAGSDTDPGRRGACIAPIG